MAHMYLGQASGSASPSPSTPKTLTPTETHSEKEPQQTHGTPEVPPLLKSCPLGMVQYDPETEPILFVFSEPNNSIYGNRGEGVKIVLNNCTLATFRSKMSGASLREPIIKPTGAFTPFYKEDRLVGVLLKPKGKWSQERFYLRKLGRKS